MPDVKMIPTYADPNAEAVILSAEPGPPPDPNRIEVIPNENGLLVLALHEPGVTDPATPATLILDRSGADQLREVFDRCFPRYDVD